MLRCFFLAALFIASLPAADAPGIAAEVLRLRAERLQAGGDAVLAQQVLDLADGVAAGTISLGDAASVMALVDGSSPPLRAAPAAVPAAAVPEVLDVAPAPPPVVAPAAPPTVAPAPPVVEAPAPPPATSLDAHGASAVEATGALEGKAAEGPRGEVLAVQAGADGRPHVVAISLGQVNGIREGQGLRILRADTAVVVGKVSKVKDDLSFAILVAGTWATADATVAAGDLVILDP